MTQLAFGVRNAVARPMVPRPSPRRFIDRSFARFCGQQIWKRTSIRPCGVAGGKYTPSKSKTSKTRTVEGVKFVHGFLQHALPKGFRKVRHYGWMASNSRTTLDRIKWLVWLVWLFLGWTYWLGSGVTPQPESRQPQRPKCPHCGGALSIIAMTNEEGRIICRVPPDHATKFLDSG